MSLRLIYFMLALSASLIGEQAFAACSTPTGTAGDIIYNSTYNVLQYCNGTNWINAGSLNASGGAMTTNYFCTYNGSSVTCGTPYTGTGNAVMSASPTITGTLAGAGSTWTGNVAIGTTTTNGALNVVGTVTATTFSGSGASLTSIGTSAMGGISGTPSSTTFLRGDGTWGTLSGGGAATGTGTANNFALWSSSTAIGTSNLYQSGSNVGIGTTTPSSLLHVMGEGRFASGLRSYTRIDPSGGIYFPRPADGVENAYIARSGSGTTNNLIFASRDAFTFNSLYNGSSYQAVYQFDSSNGHAFTGGNVGIGTTSPQYLMHAVGSNSAANIQTVVANTSATAGSAAVFTAVTGSANTFLSETQGASPYATLEANSFNTGGLFIDANANAPIMFRTNANTERMRIDGSGNVGIGTTSPSTALQVNGTVTATTFSGAHTGSGSGLTGIGTSALSATGTPSATTFLRGDNTWNAVTMGTASLTGTVAIAQGGTNATTQTTNGVSYYDGTKITSGTGLVYTGSNVGIGTTSPASLLSVNGGAAIGSYSGTTAAPSNGLIVSGNVAIGTSTTSGALNVNGTVTATTFSGAHSGSGASLTSIGTSALGGITGTPSSSTFLRGDGTWGTLSGGGAATGTGTANNFALWSSSTAIGTSNLYQSGSNVGIGTTVPSYPLHVVQTNAASGTLRVVNNGTGAGAYLGNANSNYFDADYNVFRNDAQTESMRITSSGNVGIGTTSPGQKLSVAGTIESTSGGVKFPDGTTQTTASSSGTPAPDYDSGWISPPAAGGTTVLTHNLGVTTFKNVSITGSNGSGGGAESWVVGVTSSGTGSYGNSIQVKDNSSVWLSSNSNGPMFVYGSGQTWTGAATYVRVRIWK